MGASAPLEADPSSEVYSPAPQPILHQSGAAQARRDQFDPGGPPDGCHERHEVPKVRENGTHDALRDLQGAGQNGNHAMS